MTLSNIDFSVSFISPALSSNDWLICRVSLYLSPATIILLSGFIKVFNLSKNGLFGFFGLIIDLFTVSILGSEILPILISKRSA